ncbi:larval cuticle protein 65Ag1-like [Phlebotomus argentipes]|uniref:larval cuticle protein 65Ag1-like n=1 Tax=Phlebotomus argentipes TaxID=94469 RepID=UPI0028933A1D|nr:larval cuticle protein 65Ag1-like [Phlebotomus argentipes]
MIVKLIFLMFMVALMAAGFPLDSPQLLTYSSTRSDNGYQFSYSTDDQSRDEHAVVLLQKDGDKELEIFDVTGSYSFIGDDNRRYTVNYVAGVDGYRANMTISDLPAAGPPPILQIDPNALKSLVG